MAVELRDVALPEFGLPAVKPLVLKEEYIVRIDAARGRMQAAKLDVLIVYGDREHFANLAYLTGYDPRFQESLCVLPRKGKPTLLIGNEGLGYAALCPVDLNVELHQSFSQPGQPRDRLVALKRLLRKAGVDSGKRIGVAGWKYFERGELRSPKRTSEIPAWVLEAVQDAAGNAYVDKLAAPYFRAAVAWYEKLAVGVTGGELFAAVHEIVGAAFFEVGLNPGQLINLDEWMHSPVTANSSIALASGMDLQCDIIPATGSRYFTSNIEDGVALADDALRADFSALYREAWGRITARRDFMQSRLGIRLRPEVLPFSNLCGYLPPFLLSPQRAFCVA